VAGVAQPQRVGGLAYGPATQTQWGSKERQVDFFDVKGDVELLLAPRVLSFEPTSHPALHPGRSARVLMQGRNIGVIGELHPRWRQGYDLPQAPVLFELDLDAVLERDVPQAKPIPRHQPAWRDLALVVPETATHDALVSALRGDASGHVRSVTLFDVYKPQAGATDMAPGERSMAVRLELLDPEATWTDEGIDAVVKAAVARASEATGARLRG
jgi:phenylalanyl-tRNA synthetase beta chain